MKAQIIKEINDNRNDEHLVKQLKEVLKFIEGVEKDAENKKYRYAFRR